MKNLTGHELIREIEEKFSVFFPFLKLELSEPITGVIEEQATVPVGELADFSPGATPAELVQSLRGRFGWKAEVYRKYLDQWIRVSDVTALTLKEENEAGRSANTYSK